MLQGYLPVAHFVITQHVTNYATYLLRNSLALVNLLLLHRRIHVRGVH
jgi:hypothetical protein